MWVKKGKTARRLEPAAIVSQVMSPAIGTPVTRRPYGGGKIVTPFHMRYLSTLSMRMVPMCPSMDAKTRLPRYSNVL
jgi:hypothetical protein